MNPPLARPGFGPLARDVRLTPDGALAAALSAHPGARPVAIFLPTAGANAPRGRAPSEAAKAANNTDPHWRVQLCEPGDGCLVTLTINDRTGDVARRPALLAGDRAALGIRRIHDGGRGGPVWQVLVSLTGILPALFAVTGIMIWLRGRRLRRAGVSATAKLQAAE